MKFLFNPFTSALGPVLDKAKEIFYDNSTSGLTSLNLQDAVDEVQFNIDSLPIPITYKGTWDASTNTPTLSNSDTGKSGWLYQVQVAGTVDFGAGPISFEIGDKVVNNGTIWDKWDMTDAVNSVNGQMGNVVLDTDDINEGITNLYFTTERAQDATGAMATSSSKVSLTYNDSGNTLTADIVPASLNNSDISPSASIDLTKLQALSNHNRALVSDNSGYISESSVTSTELGYLSGVTSSIQSQLDSKIGFTIQSKSANFNAVSGFYYLVDSSAGTISVTLPSPTVNAQIYIKDIGNASTNNITVNRNSTDLIDGQITYSIVSNYQNVGFLSDGTNWYII